MKWNWLTIYHQERRDTFQVRINIFSESIHCDFACLIDFMRDLRFSRRWKLKSWSSVTQCSGMVGYHLFGGPCNLHLQSKQRQHSPQKATTWCSFITDTNVLLSDNHYRYDTARPENTFLVLLWILTTPNTVSHKLYKSYGELYSVSCGGAVTVSFSNYLPW